MQPIDNSDLAWLIIADFLADQNKVNESEELRESITNPETENWDREFGAIGRVGVLDICDYNEIGGCVGNIGIGVGTAGVIMKSGVGGIGGVGGRGNDGVGGAY